MLNDRDMLHDDLETEFDKLIFKAKQFNELQHNML